MTSATIKKHKTIETIFDHSITKDELVMINGGYSEAYEDYITGIDRDSANADIYNLYKIRGDRNTAMIYLNKIKDQRFKRQFIMRPCYTV